MYIKRAKQCGNDYKAVLSRSRASRLLKAHRACSLNLAPGHAVAEGKAAGYLILVSASLHASCLVCLANQISHRYLRIVLCNSRVCPPKTPRSRRGKENHRVEESAGQRKQGTVYVCETGGFRPFDATIRNKGATRGRVWEGRRGVRDGERE